MIASPPPPPPGSNVEIQCQAVLFDSVLLSMTTVLPSSELKTESSEDEPDPPQVKDPGQQARSPGSSNENPIE